ncbi:MAG TPA: restriction endonuclease subunit S [Bacteroidales bacterium]|nr:restriction endonuclease subunit S [Bacteroidales bacterium]
MGLKVFTVDFEKFAQESLMRSNYKTAVIGIEIESRIRQLERKFTRLKDYFYIVSGFAFKSADYEQEGIPLIRIGDVGNNFDEKNMVFLPEDYKEEYERFLLKKNDIIVSLTGDGKLKSDLILEDDRYLLNQRVGSLRAKENVNILFYYYLINYYSLTRLQFYWWSNGKTQLNISPFDFLNIKIPLIPKSEQDQIVAKIEPIEKRIKELKDEIKNPQEVINRVFAREFGFDESWLLEFGKGMTAGTQIAENKGLRVFYTDFKELSKSNILRFSTRFHNPPTKKLMSFLDGLDTLQVKDILLEPVHRGASPKYNPDGDVPVVKTGHLKNGYIEISQEEFVDSDFYNSSVRSQIKNGDILIASTGKISLGKIDLLEEEQDLVADSHVSIIRIDDKKYSRQFFTYFFRCILGYFQIERDFTGATNQIELYADEISNFQTPNIPLKAQQKIVDEIKVELDKQEVIKNQIKRERNKTDKIIEKAIQ